MVRATPGGRTAGAGRDQGSSGSGPARTPSAVRASATVRVKVVTQSSDGAAGSTPWVGTRPRVGFIPTSPLNAAGTRPLPAVSVPSASGTTPAATATALPELLPPLTWAAENTLLQAPYGERVPTRPVANWSMFVLPTSRAPASSSRRTTVADRAAGSVRAGQAAVVGIPATSMLSFTANGSPASGPSAAGASAAAPASSSSRMNAGWSEPAGAEGWVEGRAVARGEAVWTAVIGSPSGLVRRRTRSGAASGRW